MAKRFTDTGKWKRPWFRELGLHAKVLWQYMVDDCDHAGMWIADFNLVSFQVGFKVDEEKLRDWLGDKVVKLSVDRYFIPSFFEFQYADAKDGFKAKQSALKLLSAWNLIDDSDCLVDLTNSYLSVPGQSVDCHIKSKSISKIKSKKGSAEGKQYTPEFEKVWAAYPRKSGKVDAFEAYLGNVYEVELGDVLVAVDRYRADLALNKTESKYIKHGATFFNKRRWRDWLDPSAGKTEDFTKDPNYQPPNLDHLPWDEPGGAA